MPVRRSLALCALLLSCGDAPPAVHRARLTLIAELPHGDALSGVRFWIRGLELGPTDAHGRAPGTLEWLEGESLSLRTLCPVGHRSPPPRALELSPLASSHAPTPITLRERCEPDQAVIALVVRATHDGHALSLPVVVDREVVGQTDAGGTAHVVLRRPAGRALQVMLDSRARPKLVPRDPVRVFDVDDTQTILLFDQTFATTRERRVQPRRVRTAPPTPRSRPRRIE